MPVLHRPQTKRKFCRRYFAQIYDWSTSTCVFFLYDIPSFCHNSSHISDPKMHHPAMDSLVLSLQCGKATAVFVSSKDCDIVAQNSKCGSSGMDLIFPVLYPGNNFTAVRTGTSTSRVFVFLFRVRAARCKHMVPYRSFAVFLGTILRRIAGAVVLIRKCTTLQNVPWLCASIQEEYRATSSWSSTATSAVNID